MRPSSLLATVLVLAIVRPVAAQTVGPKGGIDLTGVSLDAGQLTSNVSPGLGLTGGGFVRLGLFGRFSVQGEVLISRKRTVLEEIVTDTVTYLDVPVMLRYRVLGAPGARRPVHAYGGGFFGSVLSAEESVLDELVDLKPSIASSDSGAVVGGDIELFPRWVIDGRYVHGLTKVYSTIGARTGTHWSIQISVAYRLFGK
jgi:hypothetical protein